MNKLKFIYGLFTLINGIFVGIATVAKVSDPAGIVLGYSFYVGCMIGGLYFVVKALEE